MFGIVQKFEYQFLCSLNYRIEVQERETTDWQKEMGSSRNVHSNGTVENNEVNSGHCSQRMAFISSSFRFYSVNLCI